LRDLVCRFSCLSGYILLKTWIAAKTTDQQQNPASGSFDKTTTQVFKRLGVAGASCIEMHISNEEAHHRQRQISLIKPPVAPSAMRGSRRSFSLISIDPKRSNRIVRWG
jgi:hypothetical protein